MGWQGSGANARRNKAALGRVTEDLVVHALEEEFATRRAPFLKFELRDSAATRNRCFVSARQPRFRALIDAGREGEPAGATGTEKNENDGDGSGAGGGQGGGGGGAVVKSGVGNGESLLLYTRTFAQSVVVAVLCDDIPPGVIVLSEHQRKNLEVTIGDTFPFSVYTDPCGVLSDVTVSIMPRFVPKADTELDGVALARAVKQFLFRTVVTRHELFLLDFEGCPLVAYITDCNLPYDEAADEEAVVVEDTFRGVVNSGTAVGLAINEKAATVKEATHFVVRGMPTITPRPQPRHLVNIITNDEELIPVKKKLLTPCVSLAAAVCEGKGKYALVDSEGTDAPTVHLDYADCCEFDRVLLYLEAEAAGAGEDFSLTPGEEEVLLPIAEKLNCRGLADLCLKRRGEFTERVRQEGIPWEEIVERNAQGGTGGGGGECLILIDGAVFDITRWLPEHPGGNSIIPKQALNRDATRFFEIYHTESAFDYLKLFYIGELLPSDADKVPQSKVPASHEFLAFLAGATPWRVKGAIKGAHKSF